MSKCREIILAFVLISSLTSCGSDSSNHQSLILDHDAKSENQQRTALSEYIIVLKSGSDIKSAIKELEEYEVRIIRDLKREQYLIEIKNDPGLEQLKSDVTRSSHINFIQPNYTYKTQ
jgi:hypothetical protein